MLLALGSALGGWSLHLLDGRLRYVHNLYGKRRYVIEADARPRRRGATASGSSSRRTTAGRRQRAALRRRRGGGRGDIKRFTPAGFNGVGVGLTCGYEWGPAVGEGYDAPFPFNGTIVRPR